MDKLSIIIPVYNTAEYLPRCIDSILDQTYPSFELILVNDGSSDNSGNICMAYARKDQRVRVIQKENGGVAAARNTGLDAATGSFVTFVDSDDWIEPDMYEQMMQTADRYCCDVVMCDCIKDFGYKQEIYTHDIRSGYYNYEQLKQEYYPRLLIMESIEYPPTISNWLILYRIRQSNSFYPSGLIRYVEGVRYSEDLLFGAEIMLNAKSFYYMKEACYYHYCMNTASASHTLVKDKWNDYLCLYRAAKERIRSARYDFSGQMDKMLLFFLYNAASDVIKTDVFSTGMKLRIVKEILDTTETKIMFQRIKISKLPIHWKLKIMTWLYKNRGIYPFILLRSLFHGK